MSREAVHWRLLPLQASACKTVLQGDSCWCCRASGESRAVARARRALEVQLKGSARLNCFGSSSVLRNRCGPCFHLLSVVTGVLVSAMGCFSLQAEELCSAPGPCCWEVACRKLEGPQHECVT